MPEFLAEGEWERRLISSKMAAISCKLGRFWTVWSRHSLRKSERQWVLPESLKRSPSAGQGWFAASLRGTPCCELREVQHSTVQSVSLSCSPWDFSSSRLSLHVVSGVKGKEKKARLALATPSSPSNTQFPWKQKERVIQSPECYVVFC